MNIRVQIVAEEVIDNKNGTFTLVIPGKELNPETVQILETLFPNLLDQAHVMLEKEALLAALATASDKVMPPKQEQEAKGKSKKSVPDHYSDNVLLK